MINGRIGWISLSTVLALGALVALATLAPPKAEAFGGGQCLIPIQTSAEWIGSGSSCSAARSQLSWLLTINAGCGVEGFCHRQEIVTRPCYSDGSTYRVGGRLKWSCNI